MARTKSIGDRVRYLLATRWGGNQTHMARDTDCSQSTLSLVATGRNEPGKRLLTLIAAHPEVNREWLFTGRGQPLQEPDLSATAAESCRIARKPLPGPPQDHTHLLTEESQLAPLAAVSPTSYWLEVQRREPITRDETAGVRDGDLILVETDRRLFPELERFYEKLCVVRLPGKRAKYCLGLVTYLDADPDVGPAHLEVDTFDLRPDPRQVVTRTIVVEHRGRRREIQRQYRLRHEGEKIRLEALHDWDLEPLLPTIEYDDIVGVCGLLLRRKL